MFAVKVQAEMQPDLTSVKQIASRNSGPTIQFFFFFFFRKNETIHMWEAMREGGPIWGVWWGVRWPVW